MPLEAQGFSVAVFPFLKTSSPVEIGPFTFKSTDATIELPEGQARAVRTISSLLFARDHFRIKSATYAITPRIEFDRPSDHLDGLRNIQALVAYAYASPHPVFGNVFLSSEHASMAVFSPGRVTAHLVRPDFHVEPIGTVPELRPDHRHEVEGFTGLYNFRHHFWVAEGSRLYGPMPHMVLNISQDLAHDLSVRDGSSTYTRLNRSVARPATDASARFFAALRWYNDANASERSDDAALVSLAIAFETLLGLPASEKSDRFADTIGLLLGRVPRVETWARQLYDARSQVVHEGAAERLLFVIPRTTKSEPESLYQSLLLYGRLVFRLCLGTLLVGTECAEVAGLAAKLVTNQERFESVCRALADNAIDPAQRLATIAPVLDDIDKYHFVWESGLRIETMLGAVRLAARTRRDCSTALAPELSEPVRRMAEAERSDNHLHQLEALRGLDAALEPVQSERVAEDIALKTLVHTTWRYLGTHYYWTLERTKGKAPEA